MTTTTNKQVRHIRMTMTQADQWFSERIWYAVQMKKPVGAEPADFYQELLIKIAEHSWEHRPTKCRKLKITLPVNPAHVNRFITCRALDLFRSHERKDRKTTFTDTPPYGSSAKTDCDRKSLETVEMWEILSTILTDEELTIVKFVADSVDRNGKGTMSAAARWRGCSPARVGRIMQKAKTTLTECGYGEA